MYTGLLRKRIVVCRLVRLRRFLVSTRLVLDSDSGLPVVSRAERFALGLVHLHRYLVDPASGDMLR